MKAIVAIVACLVCFQLGESFGRHCEKRLQSGRIEHAEWMAWHRTFSRMRDFEFERENRSREERMAERRQLIDSMLAPLSKSVPVPGPYYGGRKIEWVTNAVWTTTLENR